MLYLNFADLQGLSRVGFSSLSDQTLLELLIEGIHEAKFLTQDRCDIEPIEMWKGVFFDDVTGFVSQIHWSGLCGSGSISLNHLPASLLAIDISSNSLTGTVDVALLPHVMTFLSLWGNYFHGSIEFRALPPDLTALFISNNNFTGGMDLAKLPEFLDLCSTEFNKFSGEVDFMNLSEELTEIEVNSNCLHGSVTLSALPHALTILNIGCNNFEGNLDLVHLPDAPQYLNAEENKFTGGVDITFLPPKLRKLHISGNKFGGDIVFRKLPPALEIIELQGYHISTMFFECALPQSLVRIAVTDVHEIKILGPQKDSVTEGILQA